MEHWEIGAFDAAVGLAAAEAREPALAHWVAGFADAVESRANRLMESGRLACFSQISVGVGLRRVPAHEDALFKDGTGLVLLRRGDPWEARELALRALREHGQAWVCAKLAVRSFGLGSSSVWACAPASEGDEGAFEAFWERMSLELARAEARAVAELAARGYCMARAAEIETLREGALAGKEGAAIAASTPEGPPGVEGPARL